jgi:hypothetical protein
VNWLWINVPLMAVFFLAMAGIPLWLVFRHPDRHPGLVEQNQAVPGAPSVVSVAARYAAIHEETAPLAAIRVRARSGDDEFVVPQLVQARR